MSDFTKDLSEKLEKELSDALYSYRIEATSRQINQSINFLSILQKWNKSFNLVSTQDVSEMLNRHLLDSLSINSYLRGKNIIDVGSGAGFPGIPLAIFNPGKHFTLVDGNGKKTRFLFQVKLSLGLPSIQIRNCRVEHYQTDRQIDMVVTRAVSGIDEIVGKICHFISKDCRILFMKGMASKADISSLPQDFEVVNVDQLKILGRTRHVIEIGRKLD